MPSFTKFSLNEKILKSLVEIGFQTPTPIQSLAIPQILNRCDIIASAQTGTGKTAAFMLPILHLLSEEEFRGSRGPQVLILVPTRELAMQVADEAKKFSKYLTRTKTVCIYGGVPYPPQNRALQGHYEILVATPGRLMDHLERGKLDLSRVKLLVLDEADRMLDMGFVEAVEAIAQAIPSTRQTLLFSATIDRRILPISNKLQNQPQHIEVEQVQMPQEHIEQQLYYTDDLQHKKSVLEHMLKTMEVNQSIIFTSTKRFAEDLTEHLSDQGYAVEALHGDMHQRKRSKTIAQLRQGDIQFLVATDVAARGIDIASLSHVINFDLPFQAEDFIHRIGRTGRAGATGVAISFASHRDKAMIAKIERLLGKQIEVHVVEGLEPKMKGDDNPKPRKRGGRPPATARAQKFEGTKNWSRTDTRTQKPEGTRNWPRTDTRMQKSEGTKDWSRTDARTQRFEGAKNWPRTEGKTQKPEGTRNWPRTDARTQRSEGTKDWSRTDTRTQKFEGAKNWPRTEGKTQRSERTRSRFRVPAKS